jgi:hypothetical protein
MNLQQGEDIPIWRFSRNGAYSVRSAYYQFMESIIDNSHLKVEGKWKKLWHALRGCLPIRSCLVQKGVQCNNKCLHSDMFEENE